MQVKWVFTEIASRVELNCEKIWRIIKLTTQLLSSSTLIGNENLLYTWLMHFLSLQYESGDSSNAWMYPVKNPKLSILDYL